MGMFSKFFFRNVYKPKEDEKEIIACAAILCYCGKEKKETRDGDEIHDLHTYRIVTGPNHGYCFEKIHDLGFNRESCAVGSVQGFITTLGRFVSRTEALEIAHDNNQISDYIYEFRAENTNELQSEDLIWH